MSRTAMFMFVILFWVVAIPIISMVGGYANEQYDAFSAAQANSAAGSVSFSSFGIFFDIMFFRLTDNEAFAVPVWISLILWMITLMSLYIAVYFVLDIIHGGS